MEKGYMENGSGVEITRTSVFHFIGHIPRAGAIVLAVILIALSAATIGVIRNNDLLDFVQDADRGTLTEAGRELQTLISRSLAAAGWLILLAIVVVIAEGIAILLHLLLMRAQTWKLVVSILEIIFSFLVAFCYFATGIACAVYAGAWGEPPDGCPEDDKGEVHCDSMPLTATNALEAVFCFLQVGVFSLLAVLIIFNLIKRKV